MPELNGGPKVSVILPVYNGESTVLTAVQSILGQTLRDIELLVVDDGSTDGTPSVLAGVRDPRLRVIRLEKNQGRSAARNLALVRAQGEFAAMIDADDVSYPERLAEQAAFLDSRPEVVLCGAWAHLVDSDGLKSEWRQPEEAHAIRSSLLRSNAFIHSTVMLRKDILAEVGGFDTSMHWGEDYDLYLRIASRFPVANIPRVLAAYRGHSGARYSLSEQWHKVGVKWKALTDYGYPAWQAVYLATPLLAAWIPARWKVAAKRRLLG